jgi:hypothetical protein
MRRIETQSHHERKRIFPWISVICGAFVMQGQVIRRKSRIPKPIPCPVRINDFLGEIGT